ncbi:UNVERIFIED_CONTAM: hypothetical protein K2H54_038414 [Gekko kuhli]
MASAPELKRTEELALFETLITDALERLSDRVEIMISPINEKLQIMNNKLEVIAEEVKKVKIQSETNAEEITDLQKTISKQQEEIVQHQDKLIQIESYLRHSKIKLCGVPEDMCTSENLPQTLMSWFGDMLHLEEGTPGFVETAHRVGNQRWKNPRDIIVQITSSSARDEILSLARKGKTPRLQNNKVLIFPDTPAEALQRRKLLKETVMTLRNMGQKYKWAPSGRLVNVVSDDHGDSRAETPSTVTEVDMDLDSYQVALEDVLTWLLSAGSASNFLEGQVAFSHPK